MDSFHCNVWKMKNKIISQVKSNWEKCCLGIFCQVEILLWIHCPCGVALPGATYQEAAASKDCKNNVLSWCSLVLIFKANVGTELALIKNKCVSLMLPEVCWKVGLKQLAFVVRKTPCCGWTVLQFMSFMLQFSFLSKHNFFHLNNAFLHLWLFLNLEGEEQYNLIPLVVNKKKCD